MRQLKKSQEKILKFICRVAKEIYRLGTYMGELFELGKKLIFKLICIIGVSILLFSIPFILPLLLKFFLKIRWFENVEEFKNLMSVFSNKYVIIFLVLGIIIFLGCIGKLGEYLNKFISKIKKIGYENGDTKVFAEMIQEVKESEAKKNFSEKLEKADNSSDERRGILEILKKYSNRQMHILNMPESTKCSECEHKKVEEENKKIRNFAAYNIINHRVKMLLRTIYQNDYIETEQFRNEVISDYKKRNKNKIRYTNKGLDELASNKCDTMYNGLKFLNIIEPSEDNKTINLTAEGKMFVKNYIIEKEDE